MAEYVEIGGTLHCVAEGNKAVLAAEVYDAEKGKKQSVINAELEESIGNAGKIGDVQMNGTSIVTDKVANFTVETESKENSTNPISAGAVYSEMEEVVCIEEVTDEDSTIDGFDVQADTVWNKAQVLSELQKEQVRENIGAQKKLGVISVSVDRKTGNPSVSVSTVNDGISLAFSGLKGEKGEKGTQGDTIIIDTENAQTYKLYSDTGQNTDGAVTQKAVTDALSQKQDSLIFDSEPTEGSTNPVTSGGIASARQTDKDRVEQIYKMLVETMFTDPAQNTQVEGTFLSRTTGGGITLANPIARFVGIKGNTLVWNQLITNGDFSNGTTGWSIYGKSYISMSVENNIATLTNINEGAISGDSSSIAIRAPQTSGHIYYCKFDAMISWEGAMMAWELGSNTHKTFGIAEQNVWNTYKWIYTSALTKSDGGFRLKAAGTSFGSAAMPAGATYKLRKIVCIDLTQMFGSGNEPTLAEFEAMFPLDYYDNNAGSLLNNNATSLVSKDSENNTLDTITLNIPTLTGKLNGEGDSVTIFADGMKSAGSVYDEIYKENGVWKAAVRIGKVDLGTLTWKYNTTYDRIRFETSGLSSVIKSHSVANSVIVENLVISNGAENLNWSIFWNGVAKNGSGAVGKYMSLRYSDNMLTIYDTTYTDAAAFQTAMNGVMLNYELATPLVYVLDNELQELLNVATGGTESILPENGSSPTTAPAKVRIIYREPVS